MRALLLGLALVLLTGHGPFQCQSREVDLASAALSAGDPKGALEILTDLADDTPEVHLARGLAHLLADAPDEANAALDQAYRLVAGAEARGEPLANGPTLRQRLAFLRGLLAAKRENWADALVEFRKALELDPGDEDARWNLEMAWYKANPPCPAREDDHEPDDTRADAPPWAEAHAKDRLLCPGNADWYALPDVPANGMLYVRLKGELDTKDEETREVGLALFGPGDQDDQPTRQAPVVAGQAAVAVGGVRRAGAWHVRVEGPGRAEFKYGVEVEIVPPCPVDDALEENDSFEAARGVEPKEHKGLKACPGDPDWYRIDVPRTQGMRVSVAYDASRAPLRATLYDQHGTPVVEGRESPGGIGLRVPQLEKPPTPDPGAGGAGGQPADPPPEGPPQAWYVEVLTATDEENSYALVIEPDDDNEGKDKDQNKQDKQDEDKDQDKQDKDKQDEDKDQDKQDQDKDQDKQDPGEGQPPPPQEEQVDLDKLIDALDKHPQNPQLEKALRNLQVVPRMEDY